MRSDSTRRTAAGTRAPVDAAAGDILLFQTSAPHRAGGDRDPSPGPQQDFQRVDAFAAPGRLAEREPSCLTHSSVAIYLTPARVCGMRCTPHEEGCMHPPAAPDSQGPETVVTFAPRCRSTARHAQCNSCRGERLAVAGQRTGLERIEAVVGSRWRLNYFSL